MKKRRLNGKSTVKKGVNYLTIMFEVSTMHPMRNACGVFTYASEDNHAYKKALRNLRRDI